mmetsp:Transcript_46915/g.53302  ORF Transcript_46915/g.53302 Transcript_46915/m.53302 type:complete len:89 (+) Transcript_46915:110-376(+)
MADNNDTNSDDSETESDVDDYNPSPRMPPTRESEALLMLPPKLLLSTLRETLLLLRKKNVRNLLMMRPANSCSCQVMGRPSNAVAASV